MKPVIRRPRADANTEISTLVETMQRTGQRLEELTGGQVDSVVDRSGRMLLMRGVQEQLRHADDARQASILNALPTHIALLNGQGLILSVNDAWRRFAICNAFHCPGHGVGVNYLEICDNALGDRSAEAREVATGIRAVLAGSAKSYSIEYPCHTPDEKRWFLMTVTPLADDRAHGAVVMHLNITERKRGEDALRESEARFRSLSMLSSDWFWEQDEDHRFVRFSGGEGVQGWGPDQGKAVGLHRWDLGGVVPISCSWEEHKAGLEARAPFRNFEYQRVLADGRLQYVEASGEPVFDASGRFTGYRGVATEITVRKAAEARILRLNRVHAVLSGINSAIIRIHERGELFEEVCRIAVSAGGFTVARSIELDSNGIARIAAVSEADPGLFRNIVDDYNRDPEHADSLLALALRGSKVMISNDVAGDPRMPNRVELTRKGNYALAVLPIVVGQRLAGAIVLRARDAGAFNDDEMHLLRELTGNVSLALDHMEKEEKLGVLAAQRKRDQDALQRFAGAMDTVADAIMLTDRASMRYIHVNRAACDHLHRTREQLLAQRPWEILQMPRADLEREFDLLIASGEPAKPLEMLMPGPEGPVVWIEIRRHAQWSGESWIIVTLVRDITERRKTEARLLRLNRVYAVLTGINALIMRAHSRDELFKDACRIAVEQGGFTLAWLGIVNPKAMELVPVASAGTTEDHLALINQRFSLGLDAPHGNTFSARAIREKKITVSNDVQNDPDVLFKDEHARRGSRSMAMLPLQVADEVVGVLALYSGEVGFFDADELKLLDELSHDIAYALDHIGKQEKLDYLAYYDPLTGFANRALFHERLEQSVASAREKGAKLAVILLDINRFKTINDTLGRSAGDELLKALAARILEHTGDAGRLARVDADHFAIMVPDLQSESEVARRIERRTEEIFGPPFRIGESELRVSARFGIAMYPADGNDADSLLKNAESAIKNAKTRNERYLFYTQSMNERVAENLSLENHLREALEKSQFLLYYQPKVDMQSGRVSSVEALLRWNDPRSGLVAPGLFIPVLEETGMIQEVGRWALRQAVGAYLRWRDAGLAAVRIAVNVSPLQLRNHGFVDEIRQAISVDPRAAEGLELEITESLIMEDVRRSIASLQAIRAMGVTIAIDDFGTGFSSLSYLAKLPVDTLKIDRSFVTDMTSGPEGLALVSTIISLAHSIKLKVVAEGVETEEQSRLLRLLRCDEMQGFLFSKPVPVDIFELRYLAPQSATTAGKVA